jgi:hypothetical protein
LSSRPGGFSLEFFSQGREEYPTYSKKREKANWIGRIGISFKNTLLNERGKDRSDRKTRKKTLAANRLP